MKLALFGLAPWRLIAFAAGLASFGFGMSFAPAGAHFATCLHPAGVAGFGHCPLCWGAALALLAAVTPTRPLMLMRAPQEALSRRNPRVDLRQSRAFRLGATSR